MVGRVAAVVLVVCHALGHASGCLNVFAWVDSYGDDCSSYSAYDLCTSDGRTGPGWDPSWGNISDYSSGGHSALTACCACGGGLETECSNVAGWVDSEGDNCDTWEVAQWCTLDGGFGPGWDQAWGFSWAQFADPSTGIDPRNACCGCGKDKEHGDSSPTCMNTPNWISTDLETCIDYGANNYCTSDGGYGSGWDVSWGTFQDYASLDGLDASNACCACGGGTHTEEVDPGCISEISWLNGDLESCNDYAVLQYCTADGQQGAGWDPTWGAISEYTDVHGIHALIACCECGGGGLSASPGAPPTVPNAPPTAAPPPSGGGLFGGFGGFIMTQRPTQAPVTSSPTPHTLSPVTSSPTPQPTVGNPSSAPTTSAPTICLDVENWVNRHGEDCSKYGDRQYCTPDRTTGPNWDPEWGPITTHLGANGLSGIHSCCACGGGLHYTAEEYVEPKAKTCIDDDDWTSSDGENCKIYTSFGYCKDGAEGEYWDDSWGNISDYAVDGISAAEACCACGGGMDAGQVLSCNDQPGWETSTDGETCEDFRIWDYCTSEGGEGIGWSSTWGPIQLHVDNKGVDANAACCACGGGLRETLSPTRSPTFHGQTYSPVVPPTSPPTKRPTFASKDGGRVETFVNNGTCVELVPNEARPNCGISAHGATCCPGLRCARIKQGKERCVVDARKGVVLPIGANCTSHKHCEFSCDKRATWQCLGPK